MVVPELTPLGTRLVLPAVAHVLERAGSDTVEGVACSAAAIAAGHALEAMIGEPHLGQSGIDHNPLSQREQELTPTMVLKALRPASAHFVICLVEDPLDASLLARLEGVPPEELPRRIFNAHAKAFELPSEGQRAVSDLWSHAHNHLRYTVGMWGLVTKAAFGVRHLQTEVAMLFRSRLDERVAEFGRGVADGLHALEQSLVLAASASQ